jgi:hypothetical protein
MVELQDQSLQSAVNGVMASLADRMRVRRPPEKRARVKHGPIPLDKAIETKAAWLFAVRAGVAPTVMVTINWPLIPPDKAGRHPVDRMTAIRDAMKQWLKRQVPGHSPVWIEVRENPRNKGDHVHLVVHVPPCGLLSFETAIRRWVAANSAEIKPNGLNITPIRSNWWDLFAYLMKGGTDEARDFAGTLHKHRTAQGVIDGPRVRVAHAIGQTARRASENAAGGVSDVSAVA